MLDTLALLLMDVAAWWDRDTRRVGRTMEAYMMYYVGGPDGELTPYYTTRHERVHDGWRPVRYV